MATRANSRLREVAGALALLAGAGCTASPSGDAPATVGTRAGGMGVGECEMFTANAICVPAVFDTANNAVTGSICQ